MKKQYIIVGCVIATALFIFGMKNKSHTDHIREIIIARCMASSSSSKDIRWAIQDIDKEINRTFFFNVSLGRQAHSVLHSQKIALEAEENMIAEEQERLENADLYQRADIRDRIAKHQKSIDVINTTASEKLKTLLAVIQ